MTVESQLLCVLSARVREGETKGRNLELIAYYFGFRGHPCPTLEQTGQKFSVGTRERVRQIIARDFRDLVAADDIPILRDLCELLETRQYWLYSELSLRIAESGLVGDSFYIEGLFRLLDELGYERDYEIFTAELVSLSRTAAVGIREGFVIKKSLVKEIKPLLNRVRRTPGKYGIAQLDYVDDGSRTYSMHRPLIHNLIKHSEESWIYEDGEDVWYLFEDIVANAVVNFNRKVFSLVDRCDVVRLAETYHNALRRRSQKHAYPSVEILESYLRTSRHFDRIGNQVAYTGPIDSTKSPIENDLVGYLRRHRHSKYTAIREYLSGLGYSPDNIKKAVMNSPLAHVDKSGGRLNHIYSLVETDEEPNEKDHYSQTRRRLLDLGKTDEVYESNARREQPILRNWLFGDTVEEACAICGGNYPVSALVAAHKKKRAECVEAERTDPYIVMPLCLFGCDFLYEEGHVIVRNGVLVKGEPYEGGGKGAQYLKRLFGRELKQKWLQGSASYFR